MERIKKNVKGITIVSLVITIILLLILSGIAITLALGDNGIITKAKETVEIYRKAEEKEGEELNNLYKQLASIDKDNSNLNTENINKIIEYLKVDILSSVYPIGSIYISTEISTKEDMEKKLGGKWESYGEGKTLVGVGTGIDNNYQERTFNINEQGGEYECTLSLEEMPTHNHNFSYLAVGGDDGPIAWDYNSKGASRYYHSRNTENTGESKAHNNVQPYITVYMWRRIE